VTADPHRVTQTILANDPSGVPGNCAQAAVASLLGIDIDDVPHFAEHRHDWILCLRAFAALHGYDVWHRSPDRYVPFGLAIGPTARGTEHAVVWRDGEMAWDPHPSRAGLTKVHDLYAFERREP
jgi:hypothetical protein